MKIFRSESLADYNTYTFNYAIYCKQENKDELDEIYRLGFLPYSNTLELKDNYYYLARSLRVELDKFTPTSENRRVDKKFNDFEYQINFIPKQSFNRTSEFDEFCLDYAAQRFDGKMSNQRFDYIFNWKYLSHIIEFKNNDEIFGYVFAVMTKEVLHYWFSFYNLEYSRLGLGKWMMFKIIEASKNMFNLKEVYLGTCYGEKAMYKMRDFKGLSYFDGNIWQTDMKKLKQKCKTDSEINLDDFKIGIIF